MHICADKITINLIGSGGFYRGIYEGQLYKYTNVVKGYQYRFFVLNRELGTLEYYMLEDIKKTRPRGAMHLAVCRPFSSFPFIYN